MASGRLADYLGKGLASDRPETLTLHPEAIGLYYSTDSGEYSTWNGSLWLEGSPAGAGVLANPMTTPGDIISGATGGSPQRLAIGTGGQVLMVVSGEPVWGTLDPVVSDSGTSYTVLAADLGKYRRMTATTAKTVTVNPESGEAVAESYEQQFDNWGASDITFVAGTGVTITPQAGGTLVLPQNGVAALKRVAADTWRLVGSLKPES